jgi:hypothetical protein
MHALIGAVAVGVLMSIHSAHAEETLCAGHLYFDHKSSSALVTDADPIGGIKKTCVIREGTEAYAKVSDFCDSESDHCAFFGHIEKRDGRTTYWIDRITKTGSM